MPKLYTEEQLHLALSAINQKKMKIRTAARIFAIPKSTLQDKVKGNHPGNRPGPERQLLPEEEESLVQYLLYMANQGFPLTRAMIRCYIQEIVLQSGRRTVFNLQKGPSDNWFSKFFIRHPDIAERKAENMDKARVLMSSNKMLDEFFPFLETVLGENNLHDKPHRIFNCDETGFTGKEAPRSKVIGPRGGHIFRRKVTSADHITVHLCISADGHFIPPAIIYKGSLPHQNYRDSIPGSWYFGHSENGYMDRSMFENWFASVFVPNCGKERPVMLIMDNHDSHISIKVIEKAISERILLVGLPGYTTHILQPLDVNVIGPLKGAYTKVASSLGYLNTGVSVGRAKFPLVLKYAINKIAPSTICDAFAMTGICPFNASAIDRSQIVQPAFKPSTSGGGGDAMTCGACGSYLVNPLVKRGLISKSLANILVPPQTKPQSQQQKKKRIVAEGRLISGQQMLDQLKQKEEVEAKKKEESERRKVENELKRKQKQEDDEDKKMKRMKEKEEREARKQREEEMKSLRKQKREENRQRKTKEKELKRKKNNIKKQIVSQITSSLYVCGECNEKGMPDDTLNNIFWFGCDEAGCGLWFHEHCLSQEAKEYLYETIEQRQEWFCNRCKPWLYEE